MPDIRSDVHVETAFVWRNRINRQFLQDIGTPQRIHLHYNSNFYEAAQFSGPISALQALKVSGLPVAEFELLSVETVKTLSSLPKPLAKYLDLVPEDF